MMEEVLSEKNNNDDTSTTGGSSSHFTSRRSSYTLGFLVLVSLLFLGMEYKQITVAGGREAQALHLDGKGTESSARALVDGNKGADSDGGGVRRQELEEEEEEDGIVPDDVILPFVPRLYERAGKKFDDLRIGKSCVWEQPREGEGSGAWHCKDCGLPTTATPGGGTASGGGGGGGGNPSSSSCRTLEPEGLCPRFDFLNWDAEPAGIRQRSHFRSDAMMNPSRSWVTQTMDTPSLYESPVCSSDLTMPCFDITRCPPNIPMKVYLYNPQRTPALLKKLHQAQSKFPNDIQYTTNHSDACLFIVGEGTFPTKKDMIQNPLWMAGQNHFCVGCQNDFGSHGDRTKPHSYNMEFSATMSGSIYDAQVREGYDMVAVMPQPWKRHPKYDNLDVHRKRRLLLSFKGKIERWKMPFEHHRWIASEFWRHEPDVVVDAKCGSEGEYIWKGEEAYRQLLMNSTFVFAPGGGGVGSYRFTEALAADAIPLIVSHTPLPFAPEVDWSGCVVRISEARIIDAPRILRLISPEEIRSRRERCRTLYRGIIGPTNPLFVALKIWRMRTLQANEKRDALKGVNEFIQNIAASGTDWRLEGIKGPS